MYKLIKNKQMETIMKNTKKLLTQALIIAATLTSATPMKRKLEKLENKEIENKDQNKKKKIENIGGIRLTFKKKLFLNDKTMTHLLKVKLNDKTASLKTKPFNTLLSNNEESELRTYYKKFLNKIVTENKIDPAGFNIEQQSIKNLHARRIFSDTLITHLRSIITNQNTNHIRDRFGELDYESSLKYAIRCVFYEKNHTLIDNQGIVQTIMNKIANISNLGRLDFQNLNAPQQLQSFLMLGHELLQPLSSKIIKILRLYNNQLTQVPNFNLPNLKGLYLDDNQITQVPNFNLPKLEWLSLSSNQLTQVPNFNLPNLKGLRLYNNQLTQVPNFNLPNLKALSLPSNQLTQVPTFTKIPNTCYIDYAYNPIKNS